MAENFNYYATLVKHLDYFKIKIYIQFLYQFCYRMYETHIMELKHWVKMYLNSNYLNHLFII